MNVFNQKNNPKAQVEPLTIEFKGKTVKARKLIVSSEFQMPIESAWNNLKSPELLQFLAQGMIRFLPIGDGFPQRWEEGKNYATKMRVFGFIPFGGIHYLHIEKIDDENHTISTREWDIGAKVWNHQVKMKDLGEGKIYYQDLITIYGGKMTDLITLFARKFYIHRQKRWQLVAKKNLIF